MLDRAAIEARYVSRTPESARLMQRASGTMSRGLTRSLSWFAPYPVVFGHGSGSVLTDVDGHDYVDLFGNGLSLIHGHAYAPITEALREMLPHGTAWPGASEAQIEFAELLAARVPGGEQVRFANTGTEATMLGVKLARAALGRPTIIKAWDGYHGSYDDLEAGLHGQGELDGRVALARFGELESYAAALDRYQGQVAAIIVEPVQYTGVVTTPPEGFLTALRDLARDAGVLFVLDDCLMFRLAQGGSAERFGFEADITCLGKWIGGGLPVGAIVASEGLMQLFDPVAERRLYHGGSFNGNPLGSVAGTIAVRDLTAREIERIDGLGDRIRTGVQQAAQAAGVPLRTSGIGSAFGVYVLHGDDGGIDGHASALLHLAAVSHGVYYGSGGEFGLGTTLDDETVDIVLERLSAAIGDLAAAGAATTSPSLVE
ncbi:MAG TPA: aminotransferase class III-fold pyridoxal phosphate-dependent enzyme [Solirubrobacteraceae bacterium]|nr:aminotransferase class III-fold pyridoxal phosphate-dependent enzyme [Solirubrobacteraceae bacterium]